MSATYPSGVGAIPIVALDYSTAEPALAMARTLGDRCHFYKVGSELFTAAGPGIVRTLREELGADVFLDLKFHDIPNTVAKAVAAVAHLSPQVLTVHAAGGREMMAAAKAAAPPGTKVVGVTVLTSLDGSDLSATGVTGSAADQVNRLTDLAREAGIDGIVCSGDEVAAAKRDWPDGFFVVPGIRPEGAAPGDQKRTVTPRQALDDGASILVIGRPVTEAPNPAGALRAIEASLNKEVVR
jgi:orotidine-5'-phosphate decarboxylase